MRLPDDVYNVLKYIALYVLPALATFVGTVGIAVGWESTGIAVTIITATATFIGGLIGISAVNYNKDKEGSGDGNSTANS
ncbi:MAG: holin [Mogibacterium sp.]|nr:holin [Mogibacterium sp.]